MKSAKARGIAFKVSSIYALVTGAWILFSDQFLVRLVQDTEKLTRLQTLKGWLFVVASACLIAWLIYHYVSILREEDKKLLRTTALLDNVLANVPHYIFWKDRNGKYLGCNQRFASVAGVGRRENIVGKTDYDLAWHKKEANIFVQGDRQVIEKKKSIIDVEEAVRQADGVEATFLTSKVPLENGEGDIVGLIGICRDITQQKREEKARQESERKLATLMGNLPGMAYRCRNDRDWTMEYVSEGCRDLTGYSPEELVGNKKLAFAEIIPLETRKEVWESVQASLREREPFRLEYRIRDEAGRERWVWEQGEGIFDGGSEAVALEGFITDITERKRAEESLRESDRLKSEFVATAAHEFRTPLTSIMGFSEILLRQTDISSEEREEFLTYIHNRAKELSKVVAGILDIARIEAGQEIPLDKTETTPEEILAGIRPFLKSKTTSHEIRIKLEDESTKLLADKGKLGQVLENLLSNALKYSAEGSLIQIRGKRLPEGYSFSVIDQGIGMTPEQVEKVFDLFYRANASHTAVEGFGLGMNTVKHIVEAHKGKIDIKSTPEEGTTVMFTIPAK